MPRPKRKQVQASDGWTVVAGSGSSSARGNDEAEQLRDSRPTRLVNGMTLEKLIGEFEKMENRWKGTSCANNVGKMLNLREWSVGEAICVGIGSFSLDWDHRYRSLWQLTLFMAVVKSCAEIHDPKRMKTCHLADEKNQYEPITQTSLYTLKNPPSHLSTSLSCLPSPSTCPPPVSKPKSPTHHSCTRPLWTGTSFSRSS